MRRGGARIARVAVTTWPTWAPGGLASCSRGFRLHRAWRLPVAARRLSLRIPEVEALHVKLQTPVRRGADALHEKLIGADRFLADVAVFAVRGAAPEPRDVIVWQLAGVQLLADHCPNAFGVHGESRVSVLRGKARFTRVLTPGASTR